MEGIMEDQTNPKITKEKWSSPRKNHQKHFFEDCLSRLQMELPKIKEMPSIENWVCKEFERLDAKKTLLIAEAESYEIKLEVVGRLVQLQPSNKILIIAVKYYLVSLLFIIIIIIITNNINNNS